jgi:ribonucleoside-diphosphate reductase beta chain
VSEASSIPTLIERGFAPVNIDHGVFNTTRNYFETDGSLFLGESPGLLDTINTHHPQFTKLYDKMVSMNWKHNEFDFKPCLQEFATAKPSDYARMIRTLAWQWEADSVASFNVAPIVAPFISSSELWELVVEINKNEIVHGKTYSEIVKYSFVDPKAAMASVLEEVEAHRRMETVANVLAYVKKIAGKLMSGEMERSHPDARDAIMLYWVAMLLMERVQFMSSFGVTFAYAEMDSYVPIGKAVQKICNDELNVHVEADKDVLANELSLKIGRESFARILPTVQKMYNETMAAELNWTRYRLFEGGDSLPGCTCEMVENWVQFGGHAFCEAVGIKNEFKAVERNPLPFLENWIDINANQPAPQEESVGNYILGGFVPGENKVYDTDDL